MDDELPNVIELNVGGQLFTTRLATLTSDSDSMLAAMFSGRDVLDKDSQGRFFIDRKGALFQHVLNFLRDGGLPAVEDRPAVLKEAQYFQMKALVEALQMSTGEMAEDKVRADILSRFPKYDEVKRRLVNCAVEKAGKSRNIFDVGVTFLVWEGIEDKPVETGKRTGEQISFVHLVNSWFDRPGIVHLDLSDFGLNASELKGFIGPRLEKFIATVSALIAADLVDDGFKVTIFQDGSNFKRGVCQNGQERFWCLSEVNFKFTFLPVPSPSFCRDQF